MKTIHPSVYLAPGSQVAGNVTVGPESSIWQNAVLRGDMEPIKIGRGTNIQDNAVLHGSKNCPITVGDYVTIGHSAIVHGCTVGDNTLIGMGAIIMDKAVIGKNCIVGAGTVITGGKSIPDNTMIFGNPPTHVRTIKPEELLHIRENADEYIELARKAMRVNV
ncbi:MAG: gamma carbonic anhydrase family protein [Eubacterium sp.]|nr:gamma carbonic anhydrase family protein [Eubacterium sp.]